LQTLTLLRHAKSGYVDGLTDFKRHLNDRGRRDALNMAGIIQARGCIPTTMLVSSSVRTRETAQIIREYLDLPLDCIRFIPELYLATAEILTREINQCADSPHLMLIAHNPGLEALSVMLDAAAPEHMSTCQLHHFKLANTSEGGDDKNVSAQIRQTESQAETANIPSELRIRGNMAASLSYYEIPGQSACGYEEMG